MSLNLATYFFEPTQKVLGHCLKDVIYTDPGGADFLCEKETGIQTMGGQVELQFDNDNSLYISWENIRGWEQYSLGCSSSTFWNEELPRWSVAKSKWWEEFVGKRLIKVESWGYQDAAQEQHLVKLIWENSQAIAIANWKEEQDFLPRFPFGDDVWIIFSESDITELSRKMELVKICAQEYKK